jgi:hypothetical protein
MLFSNQDSGWKPFEGRHFYCIHDDHPLLLNPFFLLLKLPQIKTNRIGVALLCFLVGHNWIFNCVKWESIGEQDSKTMGSTVQPLLMKNRLPPGGFLLGSHLTSFIFLIIIKVFIGILGQSFEIKFFAVFFITTYLFKTWFYQIWNQLLFLSSRFSLGY